MRIIMGENTKEEWCPSTHGGAGYAMGSYWDGDSIICGNCGERIENPPSTGRKEYYYSFREKPFQKFLSFFTGKPLIRKSEPLWPEWIMGTKGKYYQSLR